MKSFALLSALFALACAPSAKADPVSPGEKMSGLLQAVKENCPWPNPVQPYAEGLLKRYVAQFVFPEERSFSMLSTAMLSGVGRVGSANINAGYCTIVFLGRKNDAYWEKNSNFFAGAKKAGVLPEQQFNGFDAEGVMILAPLGEPRN